MRVLFKAYDEIVPLESLKKSPFQRNKHPKEQIQRLAKIMKAHGVRHPIHVSKQTNTICFGHGRKEAAILNGWDTFPVVYQDFQSEQEEFACVQSDNAIAAWADLDLSAINSDIINFGPEFDIDLLGIQGFVLEPADKLRPGCDDDEIPEVNESFVKLGDIWQLGNHRLMCGDSTSLDAVEKLMNGEKAELLLTDPPYGVSYTEKNEWLNSFETGHRLTRAIENDSKTPDQMNEFWFTVLSNAHMALADKCSYYICSPQGGDLMMMMMSIIRAGFQLKHMLIWVKNNHVLGRCDYNYKHEPILYGWKDNGTHEFYGNGKYKTSVWEFNMPLKNDLHPTMKPVELMVEAILNSSTKDSVTIDLFGGSGSTLIACEKTNRRCFIMELDPHYCRVIIERWQKYTNKQAVRLNGETT